MENKTQNNIKELAFVVPKDVSFEQPTSELNQIQLERYHEVLHILWNKLQDGLGEFSGFDWTFKKVILKHSEVVLEMEKRGIKHYQPINKLDEVHAYPELHKNIEYEKELSKELGDEVQISFSPEKIKTKDSQ